MTPMTGQRSSVNGQRKAPIATSDAAALGDRCAVMIPRALPRRRVFLLALTGAAVLLLAAAPLAAADWISPESGGGSPNAENIDTLYKIVLYIGIAVFLLVEGLLITAIIRF